VWATALPSSFPYFLWEANAICSSSRASFRGQSRFLPAGYTTLPGGARFHNIIGALPFSPKVPQLATDIGTEFGPLLASPKPGYAALRLSLGVASHEFSTLLFVRALRQIGVACTATMTTTTDISWSRLRAGRSRRPQTPAPRLWV